MLERVPTRIPTRTTSPASPRPSSPRSARSPASRTSPTSSSTTCRDDWLVESKSLKLYLASFRNHGAFHEDCTVAIGKRLVELLEPHYLRIGGYWYPRGGMPIDVFWQTGTLPEGVWLPDQGVAPYRGRG